MDFYPFSGEKRPFTEVLVEELTGERRRRRRRPFLREGEGVVKETEGGVC
jgi:hypothetical protein